MSLDKAELCDSLLTWTFQVPSCSSKQDLMSGVAVANVLHQIDPSWFNETWLGRIKEESGATGVSNLKKILKSMMEYYHDVLGHQVSEVHMPDVTLIGEMGDVTELGKLVQLVLGCAVSCEKKEEQIQQIMRLEESVQHVVMTAIQEDPSAEPGSPETYGTLTTQLSVALEEKSSLQAESRSLKEKLLLCDSVDNSRDDVRVRSEILEREVVDLQQRNEDLTSLAQEAQSLKDEMDILRKLEDLGDLRRQVRLLEERNTVYMQRTCELEEELRRANARLISERDTLRETNDELRCAQVQQRGLSGSGGLRDNDVTVGNLAAEILPTELKETVVRLQSENKMLCVQEETYRQRVVEVQAELEEAQRSKNALETQNRLDQQQISELRSQIEELQKALHDQDGKTEDSSLLKKKLEEHLEKLHEAHSDLQKKREVIDDLEPKVDGKMLKKIDELQESLKKKDADMKQMEERYKRYQQPGPGAPEIQALKNQLTEKEKKLQHLEHDYEKSRVRHDQEEKLIITAWYNMAMSFLAQQRQSTNAKRGLIRHHPR
ncbi:hypothetical protein F7725_003922 [Dissostichus mawsoni]|uniref:Calponin-homology (CH) domain-containing protein n=1 Tax=Dissostichus mawsoni TaxID=36200 RepID=A0A7J5YBM4_DISMA|nr:hypothetical protein F7725_003922 [Dissostichus mawsoni]